MTPGREAPLRATYRLQLGLGMGFAEACALVPYLRRLGVSHLYLSPVLQARSGSAHGYDVTDPTRVSEDLGGEEGLRALAAEGLPLILDLVPNHMAVSDENPYWSDPGRRARFFDIDPATGRHRRFFDIDDLAGVRQEDPEVFEETHRLPLRLVADGVAAGLRIDHPDGLADPAGYLRRLAERGVEHVWVEKILEDGERLPADWPVEGTTGYEFLNDVTGLFLDPAGEAPLTGLLAELCGETRPFGQVAAEAKLEQARGPLAPDVQRLRRALDEADMDEAVAALDVYRTYVRPEAGHVSDADRAVIARAPLPETVRRALLLEDRGRDAFVVRFQQTTGPVMAKGVEDTAFYRYPRLLALNEVGGDPGRFGRSAAQMHAANGLRAERHPRGLLALQTHDTKRGGDVRARLAALSAIPAVWAAWVRQWRRRNTALRAADGEGPDPWEEYTILQTLVGAWPVDRERLQEYVLKALREAKRTTSWEAPDVRHEEAVLEWCAELLESGEFRRGLEEIVLRLDELGVPAALGQSLIHLTSPGVPDIYQGDELWSFTLVDPDNRRPIEWPRRATALEEIAAGAAARASTAKLHLLYHALALRARRPEAFAGGYRPLEAGEGAFAYARGDAVIAATAIRLGGDEEPVRVPDDLAGPWHAVLTGARLELGGAMPLSELRAGAPVALLERVPGGRAHRS